MDPMTEIFCDESAAILREIRKGLCSREPADGFAKAELQGFFRSVHTLKADSAMMLYENMAQLSKELESLLYCFQDEECCDGDTERFCGLLLDYIAFFEQEIDLILQGIAPTDDALPLQERITAYTQELMAKMKEEERQKYHLQMQKPVKQRFYIAGAGTQKPEDSADKKEEPLPDTRAVQDKKFVITLDQRNAICRSARLILQLVDGMGYALGKNDSGLFTREQYKKLSKISDDLAYVKKGLANADFVPVARKLEIVVDEMAEKLNKHAKFVVKGEHTPIETEKREKISAALIHIVRNAMDHGIESPEERELSGKTPMGLIRLKIATENGNLRISVSDDGAGIDKKKVLQKAAQKGLLKKEPETYSDEEIFDLLLISGFSTTEEVGEYSGRGVGMDVISYNVKEMGGRLRISSEEGLGTKITMKF